MAVVFEGLVCGAKLVVEGTEKLEDLSSDIEPLAQRPKLLADIVVDLGNASLAQGVDDPQCFPGSSKAVVDMKSGQHGSEQRSEDRHMLGLVGGRAGYQTEAKILGNLQSRLILGYQPILSRVVGGSDMRDERAGDAVQKRELVQGGAQVAQAERRSEQRLRNVPLAQIKVLGEDVAERQRASTSPGLQGEDGRRLAIYVVLLLARPLLRGDIEIEGVRGIGEYLVGQLVGNLLHKQLCRNVRGPGYARYRYLPAERQAGGSHGALMRRSKVGGS